MNTLPQAPRRHPELVEIFHRCEGKYLSDDELDLLLKLYPDRQTEVETARSVRGLATSVVKRVVSEIFAQYAYEQNHELAMAKCPRDVGYVLAYAVTAMLLRDPAWFDNKVLIWLKSILQSFDFPERNRGAGAALFADDELERQLAELPKKSRSIFHTYYRLKQEMERELELDQADCLAPFLQQTIDTLTEAY